MSKELDKMDDETKYEFNVYCRQLNKDLTNLMGCLRKQDEDNKPILYAGRHLKKVILPYEEYQKMQQRLESIDNANPSEVLDYLDKLEECANGMKDLPKSNWIDLAENEAELDLKIMDWVETIKFELFKGKQALIKAQKNNSSDEILQKFYQEGITLDSVRTLNKENAKYKRVLELIKKKCVSMWHLMKSKTVEDYNSYLVIEGIEDTKVFELTEDEFDLLKEYLI